VPVEPDEPVLLPLPLPIEPELDEPLPVELPVVDWSLVEPVEPVLEPLDCAIVGCAATRSPAIPRPATVPQPKCFMCFPPSLRSEPGESCRGRRVWLRIR
jgi:hypothetical protein